MNMHRDVAEVHRELKSAVLHWERAEQNVVLLFAEIVHGQLHRELGYPDIHSYAREELGFSKSRTSHFLQLVQAMKGMPALREAVEKRELAWTKAAEIARRATPESAKAWVEVAKQSTRSQLRAKMKQSARLAPPALALEGSPALTDEPLPVMTEIRLRMNPLQLQRYEHAMRQLRQSGQDGVEVMLQALEGSVATEANSSNSEPLRRRNSPNTIVMQDCPSCGTAISKSNLGDRRLQPVQAAAARCDAVVQTNGRRRNTIAPRLRRQALERDAYRCTTRGCTHTHDLQVHHLHERQHGGRDTLDNLITLCRRCHESMHRA